jgi:hypothetical protein
MGMKQVDAVYAAVISITGFNGEGVFTPSSDEKEVIRMTLLEGFRSDKISFAKGKFTEYYSTEKEQKEYVSGLLNNWMRKDERLNGGVKYTAKNPGSRSGQGDATLKAMRALLQTPDLTEDDKAEINLEIDAHLAKITETKKPAINWDALPADLQAKFKK